VVKNRILFAGDLSEAQWNKEALAKYKEKKNLDIDVDGIVDAMKQCLTAREINVLLTNTLDGEPFGHIAMRHNISPATASRIYRGAVRKLREHYKKQGGK